MLRASTGWTRESEETHTHGSMGLMRAMAVVDSVAFAVGPAHDGLPGAEVGPAQHWHYISLLFVSRTIMMIIFP